MPIINSLKRGHMNRSTLGAIIGIFILASFINLISPSEAAEQFSLTGRVTSRSSNKPVSSVWVEVLKGGQRVGRSLTGDDGKYYVRGLDRGQYEILILRGAQQLFRGGLELTGNRTFDINL
jgi:hypothetical protein